MSKIHEAIFAVMNDMEAIGKNRSVDAPGAKYKFRGIDDMYNVLNPLFAKHKITAAPSVIEKASEFFEKTNDYGKVTRWHHVHLKVEYLFFTDDGSSLKVGPITSEGLDQSDKASNKALSAAHKYVLIELLMIPTEDIEDSDKDNPTITTSKAPNIPKAAPKPQSPSNPQGNKGYPSEAQLKRLFAISKNANWMQQDIKDALFNIGLESTKDLSKAQYDDLCAYIEKNTLPKET